MKIALVFAFAIVSSIGLTPAFAGQPYVGGASDIGSATASAVYFKTDFNGVSDDNQWFLSLQSVAMVDTNEDENGYVYQSGASVETNDKVWTFAEVYDAGTRAWHCNDTSEDCQKLDDDVANINYIYKTIYDSGTDEWTFTYTAYKTGGGFTFKSHVYENETGDDSSTMLIGMTDHGTYEAKHYQVGVEAGALLDDIEVNHYGIGWTEVVDGTTYAKDNDWYVVEAPKDGASWDSTITCTSSTTCYFIGEDDFDDVDADYDLKSGSSMPDGEVQWFDSTSADISEGTKLWT